MSYNNTEVFTLNAAGATAADHISALQAHFTAAPGRWVLSPSASPVAGESLVIRRDAGGDCDVAIRRQGTGTLAVKVDPDQLITDAGNASTEATGGANISPDCRFNYIAANVSQRLFVVECDDAVFVIFQDTGKSHLPLIIHAGNVFEPARVSDPTADMTGHGVLIGAPSPASGTPRWFANTVQANGSRVRIPGTGQWVQSNILNGAALEATSATYAAAANSGTFRSVRPYVVEGLQVDGTNNMMLGLTKWIGAAPFINITLPPSPPLSRLESPGGQAWLYYRSTNANSGQVLSWQASVLPT